MSVYSVAVPDYVSSVVIDAEYFNVEEGILYFYKMESIEPAESTRLHFPTMTEMHRRVAAFRSWTFVKTIKQEEASVPGTASSGRERSLDVNVPPDDETGNPSASVTAP